MARKTIPVKDVVHLTNLVLERSDDSLVAERQGVAHLCEQILQATGNYKGYGFFAPFVDYDSTPPVIHDDSRRRYYV